MMMISIAILPTIVTINTSTPPSASSLCISPTPITPPHTHSAAVRSQLSKATDHEAACRAYAASFYESVTTRQAAAGCTGDADISAIDSDINAFNDLLATRCGG